MRFCEQKYDAHIGGGDGLPEFSAVLFMCKMTTDRLRSHRLRQKVANQKERRFGDWRNFQKHLL